MAPKTPTGEPAEVWAGLDWRWRIPDHADFPNSEGWTLTYDLVGVNSGASSATITAVFQTSGDDDNFWLIEVQDTTNTAYVQGRYDLIKYFLGSGTYAGRKDFVEKVSMVVRANPIGASAGALQTQNQKDLAAVLSAIDARLTNDVPESYSVLGHNVSKIPLRDLYRLRGELEKAIALERTGRFPQHHVHFDSYLDRPVTTA